MIYDDNSTASYEEKSRLLANELGKDPKDLEDEVTMTALNQRLKGIHTRFTEPKPPTTKEKIRDFFFSWNERKRKGLILVNWIFLMVVVILTILLRYDGTELSVVVVVGTITVIGLPTTVIVGLFCGCVDTSNRDLFDKLMMSVAIMVGTIIVAMTILLTILLFYWSYNIAFS